MLRERYYDQSWQDDSLVRKPSKKYVSTFNKELTDIVAMIQKIEPAKIVMNSNVSPEEECALKEIINLTKSSLEIKKADKTNTLVVMDKNEYQEQLVMKCHLQTPSYEQASSNTDKDVYKRLKKFCIKHQNCLTDNERRTILDDDWNSSNFYVLPKINKSKSIINEINTKQQEYMQMPMPEDLSSRPIVSGPKAVTKGLSKLLEKILTPLVGHQRSYIKDERDFLRKFPRHIGADSYIICCDVRSLYTSIPNSLGLQALEYWIDRLNHLIPNRFTKDFIIEGTKFVLENNYFDFNGSAWRQIIGTAMGKEVASPYACLTVGFLEETELFPNLLPAHLEARFVQTAIEQYFRFVDDGITALPNEIQPEVFQNILNSMHPQIQFTITKPTQAMIKEKIFHYNEFLSIKVYVSESGDILTDIHYKETNTHDYLHYESHHPIHIKNNIPYVLAKNIIVATSDDDMTENNLKDLVSWLLNCGYPLQVINRGIHNARLQGPAPPPEVKTTIPFISTYFSNYDSSNILDTTKNLIENSKNPRIQEAFKDAKFIHARRQPPNILQKVTNAKFITSEDEKICGITLCGRSNCKICKLYLQECSSFTTANGKLWTIKCHVKCSSLNVLYYLVCVFCDKESYTGKTDNIRDRTNNHISCIRHDSGDNKFDHHVHNCAIKKGKTLTEPFFKLFAFMTMNTYEKLRNQERRLHLLNYDTMNATNAAHS